MRRYVGWFWCAFAAFTGVTATLNAVVDPYCVYRIGPTSWNTHKRQQEHWISRGAEAARGHAAVLIAGDSRALNGLSPDHPALQSYGRVYNIAVPGSSLLETQKLLELALNSSQPPRLIIWSLPAAPGLLPSQIGDDFEWSSASGMHPAVERHLHYLLSLAASNDSCHALGCVANGHTYALEDGFLTQPKLATTPEQFLQPIPKLLKPLTAAEIDERLQGARTSLSSVATRCQKTGTELVIVFPPVHASFLRGITANGGWDVIQGQKSVAVEVANEINLAKTTMQVWDFMAFSGLNDEPLMTSNGQLMHWYLDASHFNRHLGVQLLNRVLGVNDSSGIEFGQHLTHDNLQTHLTQQDSEAAIGSRHARTRIADTTDLPTRH